MSNDFHTRNKQEWETAIKKVFPGDIPNSAQWNEVSSIVRVLTPFCAENLNHAMLPGGGGMDIDKVAVSKEQGCLELQTGPKCIYVVRPKTLYFEYIPNSPLDSFFLLETEQLLPSGVYENLSSSYEEVLELPDGSYVDRGYLDAGSMGEDEGGHEIPIPTPYRLVSRYFSGKILLVAKTGLWNSVSSTYDGRHEKMTAEEIRHQLESAHTANR